MKPDARGERVFLSDICQGIDKVLTYTAQGREAFFADPMLEEAVLYNLAVIGEAVKRRRRARSIPRSLGRTSPGCGTGLMHGYFDVNLQTVWDVVENDLRPLREKVTALLGEA